MTTPTMRVPGSPWKTFQITLLSTLHNVRITSVTLWYNGISLQSDQWDWVSAWLLFSMACISTNSSSLPTILHPEYVPRLMHHFTKLLVVAHPHQTRYQLHGGLQTELHWEEQHVHFGIQFMLSSGHMQLWKLSTSAFSSFTWNFIVECWDHYSQTWDSSVTSDTEYMRWCRDHALL